MTGKVSLGGGASVEKANAEGRKSRDNKTHRVGLGLTGLIVVLDDVNQWMDYREMKSQS